MPPTNPASSSNSHKPTVKLLIDKLTLLINLDPQHTINYGPNLVDDLVKMFIEIACDDHQKSQYGLARAYGRGCGGYDVSLQGRAPSANGVGWTANAAYLIQVGPKRPSLPTIRVDINPEGLTEIGYQHLWNVMTTVFFLDPVWLRTSRVSRLDVAADIDGVAMRDWVSTCHSDATGKSSTARKRSKHFTSVTRRTSRWWCTIKPGN